MIKLIHTKPTKAEFGNKKVFHLKSCKGTQSVEPNNEKWRKFLWRHDSHEWAWRVCCSENSDPI